MPIGTDNSVTTAENTGYVFAAADFGFTDPSNEPAADNFKAVKITTLPANGTLTDNGSPVSAGDFISVADLDSGLLVFTPATSCTSVPYDSFTFQVQDDGGTSNGGLDLDPTPRTMTINVMDASFVNHAPAGANNTITTLENTAYALTAADFGFSDTNDNPGNNFHSVQITALPNEGKLTDNGIPVSAGDFVSVNHLNAGLLIFTPGINEGGTGYDSFDFKVQDDGGTYNSGANTDASAKTMTIDVTIVNQPPSGTENTVTTLENTTYVFSSADFGFIDDNDSPADSFAAVKITSLPYFGTLTNDGVAVSAGDFVSVSDIDAGHLAFTPDTNLSGTPYVGFVFQVQDDGGTEDGGSDTDPFPKLMMFNVTWVNQAPEGTDNAVATLEDTAYAFAASDFGFTDPTEMEANAFEQVKIVTLPANGALTNDGVPVSAGDFISVANIEAHMLVFTPAANGIGAGYANFTFKVQDDGGTANGGIDLDTTARTMTIDVTAVNDAPSFTKGSNQSVDENCGARTFTGWATNMSAGQANESGQTLSFVIVSNTNTSLFAAGPAIDPATGDLTFTPATNAYGTATITIKIHDDGGTDNGGVDDSATQQFTITVNPLGTVSGRVFVDTNEDGIQDTGESGISGIVVTLYDHNTNTAVASTTTNSGGLYHFTVAPGDYYVVFNANGGTFTLQDQGSDDTVDSDANANGITAYFTLLANGLADHWDAGLLPENG